MPITAVVGHGCELNEIITIPRGLKVIMFCQRAVLKMVSEFERFQWYVLSNCNGTYKNFISYLLNYSSTRDHFCLYESGAKIPNQSFSSSAQEGDELEFRSGIFRLPVCTREFYDTSDIDQLQHLSNKKDIEVITEHHNISRYLQLKTMFNNRATYFIGGNSVLALFTCRCPCSSHVHRTSRITKGIRIRDIARGIEVNKYYAERGPVPDVWMRKRYRRVPDRKEEEDEPEYGMGSPPAPEYGMGSPPAPGYGIESPKEPLTEIPKEFLDRFVSQNLLYETSREVINEYANEGVGGLPYIVKVHVTNDGAGQPIYELYPLAGVTTDGKVIIIIRDTSNENIELQYITNFPPTYDEYLKYLEHSPYR